MRKFAIFLHKSSSGMIIAKIVEKPPKIGSKIANSQGRIVGMLTDIIGPVKSPYAVIKPLSSSLTLNPLEELYIR